MGAANPERILVGVDAFGYAENALDAAIGLAEVHNARLRLVHGVPRHRRLIPDDQPTDVEGARRAVLSSLEAHISGALLSPDVIENNLIVEASDHPAMLVLEQAKSWDADLIVIGRHRRRDVLHPGNTVRAVLSHAPCPVWIQAGPVRDVDRILVPVDLSDESLTALDTAVAWGKRFEAKLVILHAFERPDLFGGPDGETWGPTYVGDGLRKQEQEVFEKTMAERDLGNLDHELVFVECNPVHAILDLQDDIDLVMMGTHGRTGLAGAVLGNVCESVVRAGHVPVVAMRLPERSWML